jgi:FkbM family methyltransferase
MVLAHYRQMHPNVFFLEVGAYDGVSGDELYPLIDKHNLRGILIEPQQDACRRLRANYARFKQSDFAIVNAAIAERDGPVPIYRIKSGMHSPGWLHQIASFDKSNVMKHAAHISNLDSLIEIEYVRGLTFDTLFKELEIDHVDLLQVDAEGYDSTILRLFDVPYRKPAIIRFEHRHLSAGDYRQIVTMLIAQGYKIAADRADVLAYREPE